MTKSTFVKSLVILIGGVFTLLLSKASFAYGGELQKVDSFFCKNNSCIRVSSDNASKSQLREVFVFEGNLLVEIKSSKEDSLIELVAEYAVYDANSNEVSIRNISGQTYHNLALSLNTGIIRLN